MITKKEIKQEFTQDIYTFIFSVETGFYCIECEETFAPGIDGHYVSLTRTIFHSCSRF